MPVLGNIKAAVSKVAGPVRAKASAVGGVLKQKAARVGGPESGGMPSAETKLTASVGQIEKHAKRAAGARDTMQQAAGVTLPDRPTGASFPPNTGGPVFEALATDPKLANSSSPDVPSGWSAAQSGDVSPTNADFARVAADPQVRTAINTGETVLHTPGSQTSTSEANSSVATATKPPDLIPRVDPKSPLGQAIERSVQDIAAREPIKQQELANAKAVIRGEASPPKIVSFDEQLKANQQRATQETAQQQGAQQSAEGAQTSTSTPAKPEAKAGGTTHDNGDKPDKASPQGSKPGSAEAKAIYEKAKGEIAALHARSKELSKYIADNPKADDLKTNEMELLAVQNEMQSLQGNLPQMRLQSLNYQELTEDTRFLLSGELKVLTDKKEGLENIFVNGERNMARREINRMYAILHAIKNPSAEQRKILEQAEKNRMEANVEGKALIDSKYQSNVGNILERIRAICRPWYKKGPLRLVTRLSESEEQVIAQEQMRALSGQLTPEKMEEYNKKGLLKLIRNILLLAIAIVTPVLLDTGNQTFTSTVQQQGGQ